MSTPSPEDEEMQASAANGEPSREATRTLALDESLVSRVERRLEYTDYDTAEEYVAFVLRETLARVEAETDDAPADVDREEVQDRLESLGYLDS